MECSELSFVLCVSSVMWTTKKEKHETRWKMFSRRGYKSVSSLDYLDSSICNLKPSMASFDNFLKFSLNHVIFKFWKYLTKSAF